MHVGESQLVEAALKDMLGGVTEVTGTVSVQHAPFANMNFLGSLRLADKLTVVSNDNLTSMAGLGRLQTLEGGMTVLNNPMLVTLDGLAPKTIAGPVTVAKCPQLASLCSLATTTTQAAAVHVSGNAADAAVPPSLGGTGCDVAVTTTSSHSQGGGGGGGMPVVPFIVAGGLLVLVGVAAGLLLYSRRRRGPVKYTVLDTNEAFEVDLDGAAGW